MKIEEVLIPDELQSWSASTDSPLCKVCNGETRRPFQISLLGKYDVSYYFCDGCGFLGTERPYWLEEAYADAIAEEDTDLVARNLRTARILTCLLSFCFDKSDSFIDLAGGYGLFTRLMRDNGFGFYWEDSYCTNLFSKEFVWEGNSADVAAATAFEALEHMEDPVQFIRDALDRTTTKTLVFTTELFEGTPPDPMKWAYYAPNAGQHISFFQKRTLDYIAEALSLNFYTANGIHVLTSLQLRDRIFRCLTGKLSHALYFLCRYMSENNRRLPNLLQV